MSMRSCLVVWSSKQEEEGHDDVEVGACSSNGLLVQYIELQTSVNVRSRSADPASRTSECSLLNDSSSAVPTASSGDDANEKLSTSTYCQAKICRSTDEGRATSAGYEQASSVDTSGYATAALIETATGLDGSSAPYQSAAIAHRI